MALDNINEFLKLQNKVIKYKENVYSVVNINSNINPKIDKLKNINSDYIRSIIERAYSDIENNSYDSAITKSRTLLEEIFCYIIEQNGGVPDDCGKIDELYKQVRPILNLTNNCSLDSRIKGLISALNSIIVNIAGMRNVASDSHGIGSKRFNLQEHHALLFVNSAVVVANFLLSSYNLK